MVVEGNKDGKNDLCLKYHPGDGLSNTQPFFKRKKWNERWHVEKVQKKSSLDIPDLTTMQETRSGIQSARMHYAGYKQELLPEIGMIHSARNKRVNPSVSRKNLLFRNAMNMYIALSNELHLDRYSVQQFQEKYSFQSNDNFKLIKKEIKFLNEMKVESDELTQFIEQREVLIDKLRSLIDLYYENAANHDKLKGIVQKIMVRFSYLNGEISKRIPHFNARFSHRRKYFWNSIKYEQKMIQDLNFLKETPLYIFIKGSTKYDPFINTPSPRRSGSKLLFHSNRKNIQRNVKSVSSVRLKPIQDSLDQSFESHLSKASTISNFRLSKSRIQPIHDDILRKERSSGRKIAKNEHIPNPQHKRLDPMEINQTKESVDQLRSHSSIDILPKLSRIDSIPRSQSSMRELSPLNFDSIQDPQEDFLIKKVTRFNEEITRPVNRKQRTKKTPDTTFMKILPRNDMVSPNGHNIISKDQGKEIARNLQSSEQIGPIVNDSIVENDSSIQEDTFVEPIITDSSQIVSYNNEQKENGPSNTPTMKKNSRQGGTPHSLHKKTAQSLQRSKTSHSLHRSKTPHSLHHKKTPQLLHRSNTSQSLHRKKTPQSLHRKKTPQSLHRSNTSQSISPSPSRIVHSRSSNHSRIHTDVNVRKVPVTSPFHDKEMNDIDNEISIVANSPKRVDYEEHIAYIKEIYLRYLKRISKKRASHKVTDHKTGLKMDVYGPEQSLSEKDVCTCKLSPIQLEKWFLQYKKQQVKLIFRFFQGYVSRRELKRWNDAAFLIQHKWLGFRAGQRHRFLEENTARGVKMKQIRLKIFASK